MTRLQQLQEMLTETPDDVFLRYGIALEIAKTSLTEGIAKLEEILLFAPDYLPVYHRLASFYEESGNEEAAIALLSKGIALAKVQNDAWAGREMQVLKESLEY